MKISIIDASKILKCSTETVLRKARNKIIDGERISGKWFLNKESVEDYKNGKKTTINDHFSPQMNYLNSNNEDYKVINNIKEMFYSLSDRINLIENKISKQFKTIIEWNDIEFQKPKAEDVLIVTDGSIIIQAYFNREDILFDLTNDKIDSFKVKYWALWPKVNF